jgi:hypothetical protein
METAFEYVASAVVGFSILALALFFTAFPGVRFIQAHLYLRKLRRELEPVARAVGATTKTEWNTEKGQIMYFFVFPSREWMTLEVAPTGFNIYVPSFSPPQPHPPGYDVLFGAAERMRIAKNAA